jgi:hypothetical protein
MIMLQEDTAVSGFGPREPYSPAAALDSTDAREPGVFFYGELLTALSRVSESAAERVRALMPGTTE